jgi:hypothetical protein
MLPMYQSEAMWLSFESECIDTQEEYPFAVRIATGKIDAVPTENLIRSEWAFRATQCPCPSLELHPG